MEMVVDLALFGTKKLLPITSLPLHAGHGHEIRRSPHKDPQI